MVRVELSEEQIRELEKLVKTSLDRHLRQRCQAVLMSARGRSRKEVARDVVTSARTVQRWVVAYHREGLAGLARKKISGRRPKIAAELAPQILKWIEQGPEACGLNRANWTYAELRDHLYKQEGVWVAIRTLRDFCAKRQVRPYRPTYRFLRADPEKQTKARAELAELKKGPQQAT